MSNQKIDLALAFLQFQPSSAAAVLEQQRIEDVALFLSNVPYTHAAMVLKKMLPQYTARLCKHLEPVVAAGFLSEMDASFIAAILRHAERKAVNRVLELLPERTKLSCNLLLAYSETSVGAWMVTNFLTLPDDCNVGEALSRLSTSMENAIDLEQVYVVDRERYLQGAISVSSLLKAPSNKKITSMMQKNPDAISGRASLVAALNNDLWSRGECAAVVNRDHQIVGVLRHLDLRKALDRTSIPIPESHRNDTISGIYEVYGRSLLALFNTVSEATNFNKS